MKVFILIDNFQFFRDLLRTRVLDNLLEEKDHEYVVLTSFDLELVKQELKDKNIRVLSIVGKEAGALSELFYSLAKDLWCIEKPFSTYWQKRAHIAEQHNKPKSFRRLFAKALNALGFRSKLAIHLSTMFSGDRWMSKLIDAEQPSAIVYSRMFPAKLECLREAKNRKIPLILCQTSWDHPTSKGPLTVLPDSVLVWGEEMVDQMVRFHDIERDSVHIAGPPYFEDYFKMNELPTREEFWGDLNIPSDKTIINYSTGDSSLIKCNLEFIGLLHKMMQHELKDKNLHLVVRVSPKDQYDLYKPYEDLDGVTIQYPKGAGTVYGNDLWVPDKIEAMERVATLRYTDILMSVSSTITLDACCVQTPVISLAYDAHVEVKPWESVKRFYQYNHAVSVSEEKATWMVESDRELIDAINEILENPKAKLAEQQNLLKRVAYLKDGENNDHYSHLLLEQINRLTH